MEDIRADAVGEGWERIQCGVQDVKGGVIRDVQVYEMCEKLASTFVVRLVLEEDGERRK